MQKLVALALVFVLAFGFPAGVVAQGEDFDTTSASGGGVGGGAVAPGSFGGGGGAPMPVAPQAGSSGGGMGSGFITPQQVSTSSGGGFGQQPEPMVVNDFNVQTGGMGGQQQQAGAENVCAVRSGGNDVSCFNVRESQNLPIGKGPCQPWESDCRMQNNWALDVKQRQVPAGTTMTTTTTSSSQSVGGYCGDGFCADAEFQANNCCEDCNPGPGCKIGAGPGSAGYCGDGFCTEQERMGGQCHDDCGPSQKQAITGTQPVVQPYRPPPSPTFNLPTAAFGMPSGGMVIGQFSPAMIRPAGISTEDLIMQKYKRYIEQYVSSDAEQYCNDIPALVEKATATLKEKAPQLLDITKMCSSIQKQADKCKKFAPQICDQMKKQSGCDENMLDKCKTDVKQYLGQYSDPKQGQAQCEQRWNGRAMACKSSVQSASCDKSQFMGDCTKRYMADCRGQPPQQPPQQQPPTKVCAQVITPAISPDGYCKEFSTPCEVPGDWRRVDSCKTVPTTQTPPTSCPQVMTFAIAPEGYCKTFQSPCEVPANWKRVDACPAQSPVATTTPGTVCVQVITPAISPEGYCKNFPTPCDVPSNWKKVDLCPTVTSTPVATATATAVPTETVAATPTVTATVAITATATATAVATEAPTAVATQTATMPAGGILTSLFAQAGVAGESCSLSEAETACGSKWDDQSRYANCGQVQDSCDRDKFMSECLGSINQGTEQMLKNIDTQCQQRYESEKLKIEMMCYDMQDRIDTCNEQSKLACDDLDEEYASCIALAPKKQEKLQEAVQNIARDMCQFSKYKPTLINENIGDISPSATIPVTIAVSSKLSDDQVSQLKKVILSLGEPNPIGKIVIYKAKIKAESFNDLKKLSFVLDAQLDAIQRSVDMSAATTSLASGWVKSDIVPDVPASIATLEAVKQSVSEDFQPLVSDTEGKIADSADNVTKIQDDMNSRGLVYKLKWFLGMGAESEKADSEKLSAEAKSLATTEESLKNIAEQISDLSTKGALLEQANDIGKRKDVLEKMSADKKKNAAGLLSFLKIVGG